MVKAPPSFSSENTERLFYPHKSITDYAPVFNPAKAAKMGKFTAACGNKEDDRYIGRRYHNIFSKQLIRLKIFLPYFFEAF